MKLSAAIFDMDGLLLDTERVCLDAFSAACNEVGAPCLVDVYLSTIGCGEQEIFDILTAGYKEIFNYSVIHEKWRVLYEDAALHAPTPLKPGVKNIIAWLQDHDIPIAVATSTRREHAIKKLKMAGIYACFDQLVGGDEIENSKPAPDIYLEAARRLSVLPNEGIAFEDSNTGVKAAMAAGLHTFQIPDLIQPSDEVIALGVNIRPSLDEALQHVRILFNE